MLAKSVVALAVCLLPAAAADSDLRINAQHEMVFPEHYREWVWLTSGLGMSYNANAQTNLDPPFDNVFVTPAAYRQFTETGQWPDGAVFILEIRGSHSKGSINLTGHYQADVVAVEAHVKNGGKWEFYGFGKTKTPAKLMPSTANCYSCHEQHGAVDTTFVQFYPTLLPIAEAKKTVKNDVTR